MYFGQTRPMEVYDRQIRYLDYMENGIRTKGAGFVKLERQDNQCSINLQVSGLYRKDRFIRPFLALDEHGEYELCKLQMADGGIRLHLDKLDCGNMNGQGARYEQLTGFRIPISEGKEICCRLESSGRISRKEEVSEAAAIDTHSKESEFVLLRDIVPKVEISKLEEPIALEMVRTWEENEKVVEPECVEESQSMEETVHMESPAIKDDKWEQLWAIYPHKCPFADEREYLAVGPGDFVVLSERNYKLVNNSFLLHGYYNHHHLILTRIRERNKMCYYIGVPGNFLEREKRTAIMFGFKSFECAIEPAQEGDFGYYMMPVEL